MTAIHPLGKPLLWESTVLDSTGEPKIFRVWRMTAWIFLVWISAKSAFSVYLASEDWDKYLPLVYPIYALDYHSCSCPQVYFFDFPPIYFSEHKIKITRKTKFLNDCSPFCLSIFSASLIQNFWDQNESFLQLACCVKISMSKGRTFFIVRALC